MGERSALPTTPSARALRPGDLVRLEVGCVFKGYCSAVARTAVMGEPTALQEARHAAILAVEQAAVDAIRHGVSVGAVFDSAIRGLSAVDLFLAHLFADTKGFGSDAAAAILRSD